MNDKLLRMCCLPLHEYANEQVSEKGVSMDLLYLIREQVIMACTKLAESYTIENPMVDMTDAELSAMQEFYSSVWADEYLSNLRECKSGDEVVIKFLKDVPPMLGEYDFNNAQHIANLIKDITHKMTEFIQGVADK